MPRYSTNGETLSETHFPFATDNVREFVAFLKDSGGFAIY